MSFLKTIRHFDLAVANNEIPGATALSKFGRNLDVDTTLETVWSPGGLYSYLSSAEILQVSSAVAADTGVTRTSGTADAGSTNTTLTATGETFTTDDVAAGDIVINDTDEVHSKVVSVDSQTQLTVVDNGTTWSSKAYRVVGASSTGASAIKLYGLNASWNEIEDYVVLNGTTNVATVATFLRVYRAHIVHAGSGGINAGAITIGNNADTVVQAQIEASIGQTNMAMWSVPAGKQLVVLQFGVAESNNIRVSGQLWQRTENTPVFRPVGAEISTRANTVIIPLAAPRIFPAKTDIEVRSIGDNNNGKVYSAFSGWYENA